MRNEAGGRLDKILTVLLRPLSRGVTVVIAAYTIVWGFWVVNPFWQVFDTAPLYSGLSSVAPEWAWGAFAIICGLASMMTAVSDRWNAPTIFTCAAITGWHWSIVGIMYLYGDWHNTGGITALFLAVLCAYVFLNVKQNDGYK